MKILIILLALLILFGILVCYSACVVAGDADREEYEAYEAWKERQKNETDRR